jgi:hypothetical protein
MRVAWLGPSLRRIAFLLLIACGLFALSRPARAADDPAGYPRDIAPASSVFELKPAPADFQRIDRDGVELEFPGSVRSRVEPLLETIDTMRGRLSKDLGQSVLAAVHVRVARGPDQMVELAPVGFPPYDYAVGMAYPSAHLILLSMQAPFTWEATDLSEIVEHELAHLALDEAVAGHAVPLWFNEGLAMYESGEQRWQRWETLSYAAFGDRLIPLAELERGFPRDASAVSLAYAESADVVRFLAREVDRARFGSLVQRVRVGIPFGRALEDAYSTDVRKLEYEWREDVKKHLRLLPLLTGGGLFGALMMALLVAAWVRRRDHAKAKLAQWAREEAESEAAVRMRRPQVVAATRDASPAEDAPRVPSMPVVEHEGRWYTLH